MWLAALIGVLFLSAITPLWRAAPARGLITVLTGSLFFRWPNGCCSAAGSLGPPFCLGR